MQSVDQIYKEDASSALFIASWLTLLSNPSNPGTPNIRGIEDVRHLITQNGRLPAALEVYNRCNEYDACLPGLTRGKPLLLVSGADLSCALLMQLCKTYERKFSLGGKLPDICEQEENQQEEYPRKRQCLERRPGT